MKDAQIKISIFHLCLIVFPKWSPPFLDLSGIDMVLCRATNWRGDNSADGMKESRKQTIL